jgi:hypothetical protein
VAWLDDATGNDRFASPRYRDIMRPLGLGDELRAALVVDERCWGYLCLHRADGRLGFTREEAATVARLGPHLAAALRQALLLRAPTTGNPAAPGVVLLADDLSVIAVTAQAEYLLSLVDNPARGRCPSGSTPSRPRLSPWNAERSTTPHSPPPGSPPRPARG